MRSWRERAGEPELGGKTIGDLVAAQGRATAETLAKNGCPVRTMHLARLDETKPRRADDALHAGDDIAAHLLGVDAFDQPAVEEGKVLAKQYLAGSPSRHSAAACEAGSRIHDDLHIRALPPVVMDSGPRLGVPE